MQNVGSGPGEIFRDKTGGDTFNLRTLKSEGGTVTITVDGDEVNLEAAAPPPEDTTLQEAYDASGTDDPQIQLSDANGPVKIDTANTSLDAALELQKGISYGDDFNTAPNFRIFCINEGGFAGKNIGVSVEAQDNNEDDASAAGGDVINKAGSNTSGGAEGLGGNVIHQAGTGPSNNGSVDSKIGSTLSLRTTDTENRSFFDFVLESPGSATRGLTYFAAGSIAAWRFNIDTAVGGAASFNTSWPGKPTRGGGTKFRVGDIIQIRQDDANNAITEWKPFSEVRQSKASYASVGFNQWNGGNWVLPKDNATAVVVPDQLETALDLGNDFTLDDGGNGGRIVCSSTVPKTFRVSFNFTVIRPPQISLDARGQFFIGLKPSGDPDFVDALALMGTSDAGAASDGLGIQLKGYTLVVTEV
jgi:hypothetical protein